MNTKIDGIINNIDFMNKESIIAQLKKIKEINNKTYKEIESELDDIQLTETIKEARDT